jgi:hypothetical protein
MALAEPIATATANAVERVLREWRGELSRGEGARVVELEAQIEQLHKSLDSALAAEKREAARSDAVRPLLQLARALAGAARIQCQVQPVSNTARLKLQQLADEFAAKDPQ